MYTTCTLPVCVCVLCVPVPVCACVYLCTYVPVYPGFTLQAMMTSRQGTQVLVPRPWVKAWGLCALTPLLCCMCVCACRYAADGYSRARGLGVVVTTFGVGSLSALNAVAGAYAEDLPLVLIIGTPPTPLLVSMPNHTSLCPPPPPPHHTHTCTSLCPPPPPTHAYTY